MRFEEFFPSSPHATLLQSVMKLTDCNGQPVVKLSASPGKTLCNDLTLLACLRQAFGINA